jgi:hypothetical protein
MPILLRPVRPLHPPLERGKACPSRLENRPAMCCPILQWASHQGAQAGGRQAMVCRPAPAQPRLQLGLLQLGLLQLGLLQLGL